MDNKTREVTLSEHEIMEIEGFVINTLNRMFQTEQLVFDAFEKYDLILSFSAQGEYIQGSVFQLSRCEIEDGTLVNLHQPPLFVGRRHYQNSEDFEQYLDDEGVELLSDEIIPIFVTVCSVIRGFNLHKTE